MGEGEEEEEEEVKDKTDSAIREPSWEKGEEWEGRDGRGGGNMEQLNPYVTI